METQVADLGTYGEKAMNGASNAASEVKNRLEIARSSLDDGAKKLSPYSFDKGSVFNKKSNSLDKENSFAASTPSNSKSMGSTSKDNSFGADNKFDLNISKIKSSVDEAAGAAQGKLTSGQEEFAAAMASASTSATDQMASAKSSFDKSKYEINSSLYDANGKLKSTAQNTLTNTKDSLKIGADTMRNQFGTTMDSAAK